MIIWSDQVHEDYGDEEEVEEAPQRIAYPWEIGLVEEEEEDEEDEEDEGLPELLDIQVRSQTALHGGATHSAASEQGDGDDPIKK